MLCFPMKNTKETEVVAKSIVLRPEINLTKYALLYFAKKHLLVARLKFFLEKALNSF